MVGRSDPTLFQLPRPAGPPRPHLSAIRELDSKMTQFQRKFGRSRGGFMRIVTIAAAIVAATAATLALAQQEKPTQVLAENAVQVQPLSPKAMEALVAGIAFYPDSVIEQVLDASQYPDAIAEAVAGTTAAAKQQSWPASVKSLGPPRDTAAAERKRYDHRGWPWPHVHNWPTFGPRSTVFVTSSSPLKPTRRPQR